MKPTIKSEAIEAAITSLTGEDRREAIYANRCVARPIGCGQAVTPETWDTLTQREFTISGLCADCQDTIFDTKSSVHEPRAYYMPTENDFVVGRQPMTCGSAEAESRRYHLHVGKSGNRWLVADQPDAAANVYVGGGPNSDGFGGRTLTFPLVDGSEVALKGPWHANADALYADTGVDVRERHLTYVVISRRRESGRNYESIHADVLYKDEVAQLGSFHRGDVLAREWADRLGQPVWLYSQSSGGSSSGQVKPGQVFYWEGEGKPSVASAQQDAFIRG